MSCDHLSFESGEIASRLEVYCLHEVTRCLLGETHALTVVSAG